MTVYAADNAAIQYIGRYTDVSGSDTLQSNESLLQSGGNEADTHVTTLHDTDAIRLNLGADISIIFVPRVHLIVSEAI